MFKKNGSVIGVQPAVTTI